jgi:hypothetical protein
MDHAQLFQLRETYNEGRILLCFNGPFSQGLIEEIGSALKKHLQSEDASQSSALDVFAVYVELSQNIREYTAQRGFGELQSSATIVISRDELGRYIISAGNVVEAADGENLHRRIEELAQFDEAELKAMYKLRLREPRKNGGAGLGLIDVARKASVAASCGLHPIGDGTSFFSLRVVI